MKLRRTKKGFTIVELIIVIAVIAVLSAVLIPTFISLNNKANKAADQSLIKNLDTALATKAAEEGRNNTMYDALKDAEEAGYKIENLKSKEGKNLVWNQESDRFEIVSGSQANYKLWKVYKNVSDWKSAEPFSIYLNNASANSDVAVTVGFDAGDNTSIPTVSYTGSASQEVIIRTQGNMCELTINASTDTVHHYGYANETKVVAVADHSYHENGTSHKLVVTAGNVVIENSGVVFDLSATDGATATVTNNGGNVMESTVASVPSSTTFEINSLSQLESFRDATNSGEDFLGKIINLNIDVTLNGAWKPISNYWRKATVVAEDKWFAGEFNGNGHTIYGLTNKNLLPKDTNTGYNSSTPAGGTEVVYGLFASVNGANIHNLKLRNVDIVSMDPLLGDGVGALIGYSAGNTIVSNIEVNGSVIGYDAVGGIIGRSRGTSLTMNDCVNNAQVKAVRLCAGLVGQLGVTDAASSINRCTNNGNVVAEYITDPNTRAGSNHYWAAGVVNLNGVAASGAAIYTINKCANNGTITNAGQNSTNASLIYGCCGDTPTEGKVVIID